MSDSSLRKRVLFLGVENSTRSQMAEAFARIHGRDRVEAFSAGLDPSGRIHPRAILFMDELDYDLTLHTSKPLDAVPAGDYDAVVAMGCGDDDPLLQARIREEWDVPDPTFMTPGEYRTVRDSIETRVKALLDRVSPGERTFGS